MPPTTIREIFQTPWGVVEQYRCEIDRSGMMGILAWRWPQYVIVAVITFNVLFNLLKDGETHISNHSFSVALICAGFWFFILYQGGFFMGSKP